jgi:hypothetical protein
LGRFGMVLFADDNLIGNRKHLRESLLPALIDWRARKNPPLGFSTQVTINLSDDDELMRTMLEAGFRHIFCGIETPDEEALLASQKRQNTKRDLLANVRKLHREGFQVTAGFIVGFDADTPASFQRMIDFIQESGIVIATINLLKAPPGTELFTKMRNAGRLIEPFDFDENSSNIVPVMDPATLHAGFEFVLRHVYSPQYVFARARTFMESYPGPKVKHPLKRKPSLAAVGALGRIVWRLGIKSPDRGLFWGLFLWALRNRRRHIEFPLFFAALAYQFKRMYERYDAMAEAKRMEKALVEMPVTPHPASAAESAAITQSA